MILITGASGQVGMHLLQALAAKGLRTRAWIHSARSQEAVVAAGAAEVFIGDMASREDAARAMEGVDAVYYICNTANPKENEIGAQLIALAKEKGHVTFIYHSVLHSLLSEMPHHQKKQAVEKMLVDSGIPYLIIQPAVFMQMLMPAVESVKKGGPFVQKFYTSDRTKMSFVDLKDYAEAVAKMIESGTFTYGTYEFSSEGTYSRRDMEQIFSQLTGRKIVSAFISDAAILAATHHTPDSYSGQTLLTMFRHYNENNFCGNAFTLTQILGRKPITVHDYLKEALEK